MVDELVHKDFKGMCAVQVRWDDRRRGKMRGSDVRKTWERALIDTVQFLFHRQGKALYGPSKLLVRPFVPRRFHLAKKDGPGI